MRQQLRLVFGSSRAMQKVLTESVRFSATRHPVLVLGERGTGKSLLARHIHGLSSRPGVFVRESCAAIPEHLEVSHLAGHVRGAFTGADRDQVGLLESAHGGTFFLDELGLASDRVQQILLHLLDEGSLRRVGEVRERLVDVRFIGATNADLAVMVGQGEFRRDLLDRFGYLTIRIPPLADRRDEILPLADTFLQREAAELGDGRPLLSESVRASLLAAPWPGNVRELEAVCRYAVLSSPQGRTIEMCDLPPEFVATLGDVLQSRHEQSAGERARDALARSGGNKAQAARLLGISRQQFYRLLAATSAVVLWTAVTTGHTDTSSGRHALHLRPPRVIARTGIRLGT
jgi:two-component system, NtrC family, response regulator HydG